MTDAELRREIRSALESLNGQKVDREKAVAVIARVLAGHREEFQDRLPFFSGITAGEMRKSDRAGMVPTHAPDRAELWIAGWGSPMVYQDKEILTRLNIDLPFLNPQWLVF